MQVKIYRYATHTTLHSYFRNMLMTKFWRNAWVFIRNNSYSYFVCCLVSITLDCRININWSESEINHKLCSKRNEINAVFRTDQDVHVNNIQMYDVSVFVSTSSFRASNHRTKEKFWILEEKNNREILRFVLFKSVSLPGNLRQCSNQARPIHPILRLRCLFLEM